MSRARTAREDQADFNPDVDRYPKFKQVISRIIEGTDLGDREVGRIEINCLASGEATYRMWEPRGELPEGGYLPAP